MFAKECGIPMKTLARWFWTEKKGLKTETAEVQSLVKGITGHST
jgi:hypothetical protein